MLKATDLSFGYSKARPIGHGVNFSVSAGEVFCLLGPNGCGKTTLFKTLLGLIPILDGRLELDGHPVAGISRRSFARRVAYVPQANTAYFPFSVFDVVLMGRASRIGAFESPSRSDREIATAKLEELGILHLANRAYTEISGGERQMTLIARALAQQPALIVMDEPTASLDFGNQTRVLNQITALAGTGLAVVLSTHEPGYAFSCADTVALMSKGTVLATGAPDTVLTSASLGSLYGVEVAIARLDATGQGICVPVLARRGPVKPI